MEEEKTDMDLISELPEAKIVTIMSLLTMDDATRFSLASKKFFSALKKSTPILDFDFSSFKKNSRKFGSRKSFLDFVDKSLEFLSNSNDTNCCCCFERLSFSGPISNILVSEIVQFSLHNKIKELDLNGSVSSCTLPNALFSSQHLTRLKIYRFDLGLDGDGSTLVLNCPLIEDISLSCCLGFKSITLCGDKLKHVVLDSCLQLVRINIHPQVCLESFSHSPSDVSELASCEISPTLDSFKLLKFLEIKKSVVVTDEWFQDHVSGLNLLETLKLDYCPRLKNICISSDHNNLKTVVLNNCGELESISITAPKLESLEFDFKGIFGEDCNCNIINISSSSKYLKNLILRSACVTDEWIGDILSRFLYLEHLELESCNFLENIEFFAGKLTSLKLLECYNLSKLEIEVPNLVSFTYSGYLLSSPPVLISNSRFHAQLLLDEPPDIDDSYLRNFRDFLRSFSHSARLLLDEISPEVLIYPDKLRETIIPPLYDPLYDLKHLKVKVTWNRTNSIVLLVDGLLWLVPCPETISIILHDDRGLKYFKSLNFKFHNKPAVKEEYMSCCASPHIKCWRHYFVEVEMDNFDDSYERSSLEHFLIQNAKGLTITNAICNTY